MTTEAKSLTGPTANQPKKQNRYVTVALNHMTKRHDALRAQITKLTEEAKQLADAIDKLTAKGE